MRQLALILSFFLLSACYSGGRRGGDTSLAVYDLGPESAGAAPLLVKKSVALEVKAPLWFDGMGIGYRLAYDEPNRLREYARSRWAGPPAQMIQQRLEQRLGFSRAGQGRTECVLRLELTEFSQIFETPTDSFAVLRGKAVLLNRARRSMAELPISIRQTAGSPDARGGAGGLVASVEQLALRLANWEAWKETAQGCGT